MKDHLEAFKTLILQLLAGTAVFGIGSCIAVLILKFVENYPGGFFGSLVGLMLLGFLVGMYVDNLDEIKRDRRRK